MLGRAAYHTPYLLAQVDRDLFDAAARVPSRSEIVERTVRYLAREQAKGTPLAAMTRHMLGLYHGRPGARLWRRALSEEARLPGANVDVLLQARDRIEALAVRQAA